MRNGEEYDTSHVRQEYNYKESYVILTLQKIVLPSFRFEQQQQVYKGVKFTCSPAQHWGSRTPWDRNKRLWCGWVMTSPDASSYYYSGDTGLPTRFPLFEMIGDRLGPFEIAAIPIGGERLNN